MATSTWRTTYTPGSWIVLNGPKALVAAQPTSADIAERLSATWNDVVAATDLESLVGKLMRWGMDVVPDLIVVVDDDRLQCVVRGDITVTDVASGEVVANGHGQAAWRSVNLDARHIAIALPGQANTGTWRLPLAVGVVSAGSIEIDASDEVRVGVGDATFAVAPLVGVPVVAPAEAPAQPVEDAIDEAADAPVEDGAEPETVVVPEELQAPGAWATGFGDDVPLSEPSGPILAVVPDAASEPSVEDEPVAEAEPEPVVEDEAAVVDEPAEQAEDVAVEAPVDAADTASMDAVTDQVVEPEPEPVVEPAVDAVADESVEVVADQAVDPVAEVAQADDGLAAQIEAAKAAVDQAIADSQVVPVSEESPVVDQVEQPVEQVAESVDAEVATPEPEPEAAPVEQVSEPMVADSVVEVPVVVPVDDAPPAPVEPVVEAAPVDLGTPVVQPDLDKVDWQPAAQVEPVVEPAPVPAPEVAPAPAPESAPAPEPIPAPDVVPAPDAQPATPAATGSPLGATLLVFSDGQRWPVNEPLLIGRAPQAYPGETAHLVRVVSPHHDISRTHVRVELYDGAMWATDRESTNGTTVHNPGQAAATAQPGQPMHVWVGGVIDIGDGVTIRVQ